MARILITDDDPALLAFLETALQNKMHFVEKAENGKQALAILQNDEEQYDLLLTDVVMPEMDGIELSQEVRKLFPSLKILFMTGFSTVSAINKKTILTKPLHLKDLIEQIDKILACK